MDIIGKVYTNSMLVLINSRMLIGPEDIPLTIVSEMRFGTAPANNKNSAKEADGGDLGVDTEARVGMSRSSEPHPEA